MRRLAVLGLLCLPLLAVGDELKMGVAGADVVKAKCTLCHEAGHFVRLRQDRATWEDTIDLMIRRGAPIDAGEKAIILDYLTTHYGNNGGKPAR
jgi:hypothetical protein